MEWDEGQVFPRALFSKMGELGLMGMLVPEALGGAGMGYFEYKIAIEEIAKVCGSIGLSMAAHNSLCTNHILMFGSEAQRQKYLPDLASGKPSVRGASPKQTPEVMPCACAAQLLAMRHVAAGS